MTIPELIEKLEKATGPDRELDADIAVKLEGFFVDDDGRYAYIDEQFATVHSGQGKYLLVKKYTASIDAAVQLCEQKSPNEISDILRASISDLGKEFDWHICLYRHGQISKLPLRICVNLLHALQPKEGE